ncbi:TCR/Tet family MFS transporter [Pseudochryseolinea flava]|uniref:Tetracycline resistance MFS efflux pump n=1 Tax=Pseudochryseolinea flava TaxID=2059302 RepID=A0A364XZ46_9BACT|nr:TCR/Tet family MFS transporter [Pseudochryseolinea flava]RAV99079.1 tetracycline resistance MFS efflux pump [Pseudochryseolinea flava]
MEKRKAALGFIFVTLLIDVMGFGIIIPVMPELIGDLMHVEANEASEINGWMLAAFGAMQFLFSPLVGNLSDRFGRRPVLLASLFGFALDYLLLFFAPTIAWLFVGRIIAGIMGASFTTASAYIADVTPPEKRAQSYGIIGVAFGLGFILGPALGGVLSKFGPRAPFAAAAVLTLLNWLYGFFILPESLDPAHRRPFDWRRANPLGTLKFLLRYKVILGLVASIVLLYMASHAIQSTWSFYTEFKFGWTGFDIGLSLAFVGVLIAGVQGGLIRFVIPKLGERRSVYIGVFLNAIGLILLGLATQGWMMYAFLVPYCLGGITGPALQGIMSKQVPPNEQGELQGSLTSLISITSIFGPIMMSELFYYFSKPNPVGYFPGAAMITGAVFMIISALMARVSLKKNLLVTEVAPDQVPPSHH